MAKVSAQRKKPAWNAFFGKKSEINETSTYLSILSVDHFNTQGQHSTVRLKGKRHLRPRALGSYHCFLLGLLGAATQIGSEKCISIGITATFRLAALSTRKLNGYGASTSIWTQMPLSACSGAVAPPNQRSAYRRRRHGDPLYDRFDLA